MHSNVNVNVLNDLYLYDVILGQSPGFTAQHKTASSNSFFFYLAFHFIIQVHD